MNAQDIIKLVEAGFTHDEIIALEQGPIPMEPVLSAAPTPEPVPEPIDKPLPAPAPAPDPVPDPVPAPQPDQPGVQDLIKQIAHLTSVIQANAISQSIQPGGIPKIPDAADTLAEIIRPTRHIKEV